MTIAVANVNQDTDTFGQWMAKTSQLATALSNYVITTDSNTTIGDAAISGMFSANSLVTSNSGYLMLGGATSNVIASPQSIVLQTSTTSNNIITSTGMIIGGDVQYTSSFMSIGDTIFGPSNGHVTNLYIGNTIHFNQSYISENHFNALLMNTATLAVSSYGYIGDVEANVEISRDGLSIYANPTGMYIVNSFMNSTDLYISNIHANTITIAGGMNGDQLINGSLHVTGNEIVNGSLTIGSGIINGNLHVTGNEIIDGTLTIGSGIVNGNEHITGNLIVDGSGTISGPFSAGAGSTINGNEHITGNLQVDGNITTNANEHIVGSLQIDGNQTLNGTLSVNNGATITNGAVINGNITATGNITAYYSDDNLKDKLGNIENALEKLLSLNGFKYTPNQTALDLGYTMKNEVGVSAQEVQKVLPEAVVPAPISDQYLTVHYDRLIPLLIEAIKQLKAEVDSLKNDR